MLESDLAMKEGLAVTMPTCEHRDTLANYVAAFLQAPYLEEPYMTNTIDRLKADVALLTRSK
eukprot:NODE_9881_length_353_cov_22.848684_g8974_i0.p1 GENE.NODE_9881_length_353_cov_22.848684_g8974_i0~~NODE_9881_length_353_cov_22.848684_g8974_i0.p1  ORF type:complete len:62 (-),score=18.95 NODE_9881_length_353_cov_22.848684_g8974_i0:48-233(-)